MTSHFVPWWKVHKYLVIYPWEFVWTYKTYSLRPHLYKHTFPQVGSYILWISLAMVDFPLPLGPTRATVWPTDTRKLASVRTWRREGVHRDVQTGVHSGVQTDVHRNAQTGVHRSVQTGVHRGVQLCVHIRMHRFVHICVYRCVQICVHGCVHRSVQ